jgi:putative FmdB family regulatory protein
VTYEYQCKACGLTWEEEQKITAPPVEECPRCHEPKAQRLVSGGVGFQLKGSGWARDRYGS